MLNLKDAVTEYPVHDLIKKRWSPRAFTGKEISQKDLETILEASSWAFSSMNYQPWRYIYAHKNDTQNFQKMVDCLAPFNQSWAKNASVLILSMAKKNYDDGKPNISAEHDLGAANSTLALQAFSMNIYSHVMGGFDRNKTIMQLNIDEKEFNPVAFIALGYLASPDSLSAALHEREIAVRRRKPLSEFSTQL